MKSHGRRPNERLQAGAGNKGIISSFYSWIQDMRPHHYRYVVATTRRASNLVEAVRKQYPDALPDYITENGLLLLAEEIAALYKRTGSFAKIAVLDDVLVYGRNVNLFLSQLWSTVWLCLHRLDTDVEKEEAEEDFTHSIDLWIYTVNEAPILLRQEFQWTMRTRQILDERQWRELSDSIAKLIAAEDVANTSYVISAKLRCGRRDYRPDPMAWIADKELQYRDNEQHYAVYLFTQGSKPGVYPSVRSYRKREFLYFTPYFFTPELGLPQVIHLLKAVFEISSRQDPEVTVDCINLLNRIQTCAPRMMVYAQFVALLLSQITLSAFFENLDSEVELIYDTGKIARNFGVKEEIRPVLDRLCKIRWHTSQLMGLMDYLDISDAADKVPAAPAAGSVRSADVINVMERLTYKQAVDHERDAAARRLHDQMTISNDLFINRTGEQDLSRFLRRVRKQTGAGMDAVSMLPVISCLTQMMDLGDISLKSRFKRHNGSAVFYSSVRTTEMSLAIMPRKLSVFYRQFYLLARLYWRDQDFPDRVERYFRDVIFDGDAEHRNETMISNARYFAQLIAENRLIVGSMLNWDAAPEPKE